MKRVILVTIISLLVFSCSTPGKYPPPIENQALDEMESFREYFLEGRLCDAKIALDQAIDLFAKIDNICSISDAYIQRYLFLAYVDASEEKVLDKAEKFADVGRCTGQKKKIDDLRSGAGDVIEPGNAPNDIYRSVMQRKAAIRTKNRKYIDNALKIDRSHGWTMFVIRDYAILRLLTTDEKEKDMISKRMNFLQAYIQKCE
ncbi:hypothetical protein BMS3Abin07_00292 [bacterium BMS3Abin07]|nr:hypothetical protein BMS3Abin07_00292 [bacterium BMS3Abin07]GBE31803.1 hypothetical protein BMS3Bbin05_00706 [bacterium BMS3Bbin05]HDO21877.1 hypothetical protein [Nitrospirota bacterium]HDZ88609.1 hypothetical protein [Nitrospirota bacterium]